MFPIRDLNPTRITPIVTLLVIATNVLVFFLWQPQGPLGQQQFLYQRAAISCELTTGQPLTDVELVSGNCSDPARGRVIFPDKPVRLSVLVSMFLHGGLLHLLGNMWFLWIFGDNVEEAFGRIGFAVVYALSGIAATAGFVLLHPHDTQPLIGASGAIAGVLGSYLVLYPRSLVISIVVFVLLPVPAVVFLGVWFLGQFAVGDAGVAWEAHVAGFLFGMVAALLFRGALLDRVRTLHGARA